MKYLFIVLILSIVYIISNVNASNIDLNKNDDCNLCEFVIEYIEEFVQENKTETEIKNEIEHFCSFIPDSLNESCNELISNNLDNIIKMLVNEDSPRDVCNFFKFCNPIPPPPKITLNGKSTLECNVCEYLVTNIYRYVTLNSTETEIINSIDNDCKILGGNIGLTCEALVNQYFPILLNLIESDEEPSTLCNQVKLCSINKIKSFI